MEKRGPFVYLCYRADAQFEGMVESGEALACVTLALLPAPAWREGATGEPPEATSTSFVPFVSSWADCPTHGGFTFVCCGIRGTLLTEWFLQHVLIDRAMAAATVAAATVAVAGEIAVAMATVAAATAAAGVAMAAGMARAIADRSLPSRRGGAGWSGCCAPAACQAGKVARYVSTKPACRATSRSRGRVCRRTASCIHRDRAVEVGCSPQPGRVVGRPSTPSYCRCIRLVARRPGTPPRRGDTRRERSLRSISAASFSRKAGPVDLGT